MGTDNEIGGDLGAAQPPLRIDLADPAAPCVASLDGFGDCEPCGRWTVGNVAGIALPGPPPPGYAIHLRLSPFVPDGHSQIVTFSAGAGAVVRHLTDPNPVDVGVPLGAGQVRLTMLLASPLAPARTGLSADPRSLGVCVRSVWLAPLENEADNTASPDDRLGAHEALLAELARQQRRVAALEEIFARVAYGQSLALDDELVLMRTPAGLIACPRSDVALTAIFLAGHDLEGGTRRVLETLLKPGMTYVDVGANVGFHVVPAARAVGASGRVVAFEPAPLTFRALQTTVVANHLEAQVVCNELALSDRAGPATLHLSTICGHASFDPPAAVCGRADISTTRFDDAVDGAVDVVKIDVEGAEVDVVNGMARTLADNPGIAVIAEYAPSLLGRRGVTPAQWFAAFDTGGFRAYAIDEATGRCRPLDRAALDAMWSVNVLFVRGPLPSALKS